MIVIDTPTVEGLEKKRMALFLMDRRFMGHGQSEKKKTAASPPPSKKKKP